MKGSFTNQFGIRLRYTDGDRTKSGRLTIKVSIWSLLDLKEINGLRNGFMNKGINVLSIDPLMMEKAHRK